MKEKKSTRNQYKIKFINQYQSFKLYHTLFIYSAMDAFQQAIEDSRRRFETQQEQRQKKELEQKKKKDEELKAKRAEERRLKKEREVERLIKEREEREAQLKREYDQLYQEKNADQIKEREEVEHRDENAFSQSMDFVFVRDADSVQWANPRRPNDSEAPSQNSQATMKEGENFFAMMKKAQDYSYPGNARGANDADELAQAPPRLSELQSTNARDFNRLDDLIYHIDSTQNLDESNYEMTTLPIKNLRKFDKAKIGDEADEKNAHKEFFQTEKMNDDGTFNTDRAHMIQVVKAKDELERGKNTVPSRLSCLDQLGTKSVADPRKNNFMNQHQSARDNSLLVMTTQVVESRIQTTSIMQQSVDFKQADAQVHVGWEQKQLLQLEKQQNELKLKILQMEQEFKQNDQNKQQPELNDAQESPKTKIKDIQKQQEEMIKSIVLKSAVFAQDFREYDPENLEGSFKLKTGAYKEDFIMSICNKSGVFVREFREMESDPYAKEEFIMSIHLKSAKFEQIQQPSHEQELDQEFQIYEDSIQKSTPQSKKTNENKGADKDQAVQRMMNRKKQLVYEMEVKGQMRKIQKNQIKQKQQEDQQRMKLGQNLFSKIMSKKNRDANQQKVENPLPVRLNQEDSFGQKGNAGQLIEGADAQEGNMTEHKQESDQDASELFDGDGNVDEIEASTGTFGGKHRLDEQIGNQDLSKHHLKPRNIRSAAQRPVAAVKQQYQKPSPRPVSGVSQLSKATKNSKYGGISDVKTRSVEPLSDSRSSFNDRSEDLKREDLGDDLADRDVEIDLEHEVSYNFEDLSANKPDKSKFELTNTDSLYQASTNDKVRQPPIVEVDDEDVEVDHDEDSSFDRDSDEHGRSLPRNNVGSKRQNHGSNGDVESPAEIYGKDELEVYKKEIEHAIREQLSRESQQQSQFKVTKDGPEFDGGSTFNRDDDSPLNAMGQSMFKAATQVGKNATSGPFQGNHQVTKSFNDNTFNERGSTFEEDDLQDGGIDKESFGDFSIKTRSEILDATSGFDRTTETRDVNLESELQDEVESIHNVTQKKRDDGKLNPIPSSQAGQARLFYYETDEADIAVQSHDFDDMYEHGRTEQMNDLAKSRMKNDRNEDDDDEMTFGSRPATAQTDSRSGGKLNQTPASPSDIGDNSMVNIGLDTIDKKNQLIGNVFQNPKKNAYDKEETIAPRKLGYSIDDNDQLKQELLDLQKQNDMILQQIAQQSQHKSNQEGEEEGYDDDAFEKDSDYSNDGDQNLPQGKQDYPEPNSDTFKLMDSKFNLNVKDSIAASPRIGSNIKSSNNSKYYEDLSSSYNLRQKQDQIDPIKEFYEMQATLKQDREAEEQNDKEQNQFFNEFGSGGGGQSQGNSEHESDEGSDDGRGEQDLEQEANGEDRDKEDKDDKEVRDSKPRAKWSSAQRQRKPWAMQYDGFNAKDQKDIEYSDAENDEKEHQNSDQIDQDQQPESQDQELAASLPKTTESPKEDAAAAKEDHTVQAEQDQKKIPPAKAVLIDFDEECGNTMKEQKLKKFEEFKQRREIQEQQRKQQMQQKRAPSKGQRVPIVAVDYDDDNVPQTEVIQGAKGRAQDLLSKNQQQSKLMPPKPVHRTPGQKPGEKHNPKGFKGIIPKGGVAAGRQASGTRLSPGQRQAAGTPNSGRGQARSPNNWLNNKNNNFEKESEDQFSEQIHLAGDEESKYDQEAQQEDTKFPQILPSPSIQSVKSKQAPAIALRKALEKNSNKKLIKNALQLLVLAGHNEQTIKEREQAIAAIDQTNHTQYVVLFKGATGRFDFRALYAAAESEDGNTMQLVKIYGQTTSLSPLYIEDQHVEKFFKYSSGQRNFIELSNQKSLTPTTDAIVLRKVKKAYEASPRR